MKIKGMNTTYYFEIKKWKDMFSIYCGDVNYNNVSLLISKKNAKKISKFIGDGNEVLKMVKFKELIKGYEGKKE